MFKDVVFSHCWCRHFVTMEDAFFKVQFDFGEIAEIQFIALGTVYSLFRASAELGS